MQMFIIALVLGLVATLGIYPIAIPFLHKIKFGQSIRTDGPQSHLKKTLISFMHFLVNVLINA